MTESCNRHTWEIAEAVCEECQMGYCEACLVQGHGRTHCVPCALAIAGVRRSRRPRIPRKQRKQLPSTRAS